MGNNSSGYFYGAPQAGSTPIYNITAPTVIPARWLIAVVIQSLGEGTGSLTLNDCATLAAASAANQLYSDMASDIASVWPVVNVPNLTTMNLTTSGGPIAGGPWPLVNGLCVSAVPDGGAVNFIVSNQN